MFTIFARRTYVPKPHRFTFVNSLLPCFSGRSFHMALPNRTNSLSLTIANPASLLNHISHRYASASRIVMEFVDNPLDDVEPLFRKNNKYPYPIQIIVSVDMKSKTLKISDNCSGMNQAQLQSLIENVGESTKKGVSWLNGQFGFGVHSFRAAANSLRVVSRKEGEPALGMSIHRNQTEGIPPPDVCRDPPFEGSGTEISLCGFDPYWWKDISLESMVEEIEQHFERLLARENLFVIVREVVGNTIVREKRCEPFNYSLVPGTPFNRTFTTTGEHGIVHEINVAIIVAHSDFIHHKVRFFSLGRRIAEVSLVPSFMKLSTHKRNLWGHPQLIGFVDVGRSVEPVITRDEFKRSRARGTLYQKLLELEDDLKGSLDFELDQQRVVTLGKLEGVLEGVLHKIQKEDNREVRRAEKEKRMRLEEAINRTKEEEEDSESSSTTTDEQPRPEIPPKTGPPLTPPEQSIQSNEKKIPEFSDTQTLHPSQLPVHNPEEISHVVVDEDHLNEVVSNFEATFVPPSSTPNTSPSKAPATPKPETSEPENSTTDSKPSKPHKLSGFQVNFVSLPPNEQGHSPRSNIVGEVIHINTLHPDFVVRLKSRQGRPKFTERLGAYLAIIISSHYHDVQYQKIGSEPDRRKIYDDLIGTTNRIETALKRRIPQLQKSMTEVMPQGIVDTLETEEELINQNHT